MMQKDGCAKMTLNRRTILVVAGEGLETLDSVEILDPSANNFWSLDSRFVFEIYYRRTLFDKFISVELR